MNPKRLFLARIVYRILWWPVVAVAAPFIIFTSLVDWLSWTALPWLGKYAQHPFAVWRSWVLRFCNFIWGGLPKSD